MGDFVYCMKGENVNHYAIFISCDANGVTLLHNNIGGNGKVGASYDMVMFLIAICVERVMDIIEWIFIEHQIMIILMEQLIASYLIRDLRVVEIIVGQ